MYDPLTTLDQVKGWLKTTQPGDDALFESLIVSASDFLGRQLGRPNLGKIYTYQEVYFLDEQATAMRTKPLMLVLDHYPVTTFTSVTQSQIPIEIITDPALLGSRSGVWLERDARTLRFMSLQGYSPLVVNYSAGYAPKDIPAGLSQAVCQMIGEIYKSKDWIGYTSKTLAGESVSFERGSPTSWGMSPRTKAMIQPYINRIPVSGVAA